MNNDGDDIYHTGQGGSFWSIISKQNNAASPTKQSFWEHRFLGLEGSHVDSIFYCTGSSGFSNSLDSQVVDRFPGVSISDLLVRGQDALNLAIEFCRLNNIEVFWSFRMNDTHDNWYPAMLTQFKREHPELLLFQPKDIGKPRHGLVEPHMNATAMDYGREEIRDRAYEIIRDVCERYDVDGIEIDFMRQPIFFRPTLDGLQVGREHIKLMSVFMARVREMTERVGKDRGRPILITVSVPNIPSLALSIGLDVKAWLKDDLVDIMIASLEHTPFTGSVSEIVDLAHQHDAPIYGRLGSGMSGGIDCWMGAVVNTRRGGVDGIQIFNHNNPQWEGWRILGESSAMASMDKTFAVDNLISRTWEHVVELEGRLPVELAEGDVQTIRLPVGDNVAGSANDGKLAALALTIKLNRLTYSDIIEFWLNGLPLKMEVYSASEGISPVVSGTFVLYTRPDPVLMKWGDNTVKALLRKRCESAHGSPAIIDVQLTVRYRSQ